ncbi:hypothetical protein [Pedobacter sp. L105]|uniref:hypothetical protein n=1 Tax=Pedobacter sp. L105 TaxID=1641871 RepID=UPI00131E2A78|nr:hypothetical protein [Pedobacter sp. L105]
MNYLPTVFLRKAADDVRLLPSHLSLVMAIFYFRDDNTPGAPTRISRSKLMRFSRIRSIVTYHKCLKELISFGYINYVPSYHPTNASLIWLLNETE